MTRMTRCGAAVLFGLAQAGLFAGGALAEGGSISDVMAERYAQAPRCDALSHQFHERIAATNDATTARARTMASQGEALCRFGNTAEGADTLQKALDALNAPGK